MLGRLPVSSDTLQALCAWATDTLDPMGVAEAHSPTIYCLRALRAVCVPMGPGMHVDAEREACVHAFVTMGSELVVRALQACLPWKGCEPAFSSLLGAAVCRTVALPLVLQAAEVSLRNVVGVINYIEDEAALALALGALTEFARGRPEASLPLVAAVMRGLTSAVPMARAAEAGLRVFLDEHSPGAGNPAGFSWAPALPAVAVPPLMYAAFVGAAQDAGCILVLHVHLLQRLDGCTTAPAQLAVIDDALSWLPRLVLAPGPRKEEMVLLYARLALLLADQHATGTSVDKLHRRLTLLRDQLAMTAEDSDFQNFFRRFLQTDSGLPLRLRFAARAMLAFVNGVLLEHGALRAPGDPLPKAAREVLQTLDAITTGKKPRYQHVRPAAAKAVKFISKPEHGLPHMRMLLDELLWTLYGSESAIPNAV